MPYGIIRVCKDKEEAVRVANLIQQYLDILKRLCK